MNAVAKAVALAALGLTIVPPAILFLQGISTGDAKPAANGFMTDSLVKASMAAGAALWFLAAPKWLMENRPADG
jgi:hypothetical protein